MSAGVTSPGSKLVAATAQQLKIAVTCGPASSMTEMTDAGLGVTGSGLARFTFTASGGEMVFTEFNLASSGVGGSGNSYFYLWHTDPVAGSRGLGGISFSGTVSGARTPMLANLNAGSHTLVMAFQTTSTRYVVFDPTQTLVTSVESSFFYWGAQVWAP